MGWDRFVEPLWVIVAAVQVGAANFAAATGILVTALLLGGFGDDLRDGQAMTFFVDGHKREVRGTYVLRMLMNIVFDPGLDADLHGSLKDAIHGGAEDDQIADLDRDEEIHVIDRGGDGITARVAVGGERSGEIDPVHETAAQQVVQGIGIVGKNNLIHLRLRIDNGARGEIAIGIHAVAPAGSGDEFLRRR
jgi:hypothetical protein